MGQTSGENLFHSFYQFNLHEGEKAIFHASDGIHRIISRVTGPNSSWIDGGIQSMANADLYFLTPMASFLAQTPGWMYNNRFMWGRMIIFVLLINSSLIGIITHQS
ncbi:MAG: hypothetical protein OMM_07890 [Candidatus Magnetoglobus multicellularis str. Araruama]|uniref:Filamentous haemagglutinin FhaB/tRNA nuclease CdiA-like TPS domain-containing protein n=1 Tax=Candidatus Magnetoglobus multicellularis str. Araruama TaxID=890399 RepID=A0A1V1PAQ5_9BACT|nr:MAG: hypothetical protein OMM_07890 [Candidatus Magnetoglobus multicellularis str. Araruama]